MSGRTRAVVLSALVVLLVACGGDDGTLLTAPPDTPAPPDTTDATDAGTEATDGTADATVPPWSIPDVATLPPIGPTGPACGPVEGGRIAFDRETTGSDVAGEERWEIVVAAADGTELAVVLDAAALGYWSLTQPAWSPDGTRLAMTAVQEGGGGDLLVVATCDGTIESELTNLIVQYPTSDLPIDTPSTPTWSPDGRWLAISSADGLFVVDAAGTLVPVPIPLPPPFQVVPGRPSWSPDGTRVVVAVDDGLLVRLAVVPVTGGPLQVLPGEVRYEFQPAWSPDGTTIAFRREAGDTGGIWLIDADGSNPRPLTPDGVDAYQPSWSPDGDEVVYVAEVADGDLRLRVIGADGTGDRPLTSEDTPAHWEAWPSWTP